MLFNHSQFNSRDELIWAVVGSICVPFVFIRDFPIKCGEDVSSFSISSVVIVTHHTIMRSIEYGVIVASRL